MTRQTWTALVSAVVFVACAAALALVPVPFITWTPGSAIDVLGSSSAGRPNLTVSDTRTYPTSGRLDLMTVAVTDADARLTLPQALLAYALPDRDTLPRDNVYAPGKSAAQVESEEAQMMQSAQSEAVVAALRAAHTPVAERPQIVAVRKNGPAAGKLRPGDFVVAVDGAKVTDFREIPRIVQRHKIGQAMRFTVERDDRTLTERVITGRSGDDPNQAAIGVTVQTGYKYPSTVAFGINPDIGGPSAGLIFALGIYDLVTPGSLVDGRHIAGTGEIDVDGRVSAIGGLQQKISAAQRAGATIFLVPADNCDDLRGFRTSMRIIKVHNLQQAITDLGELQDPDAAAEVPGC